jgi:hypothetical protein
MGWPLGYHSERGMFGSPLGPGAQRVVHEPEGARVALSGADRIERVAADAATTPPSQHTIVLLGAFNPLILDPNWLEQNGVISRADLEQAVASGTWLASREFSSMDFRTFALQVDRDRLQVAMTPEAETPLLIADVVANIFTLLAHTPIHAVGFNHASHFQVGAETIEAVGKRFAASEDVASLLPGIALQSVEWSAERPDDYAGAVRVTAQPSVVIRGLYFALNDHYELGEAGSGQTAVELVGSEWQHSLSRADAIFETLLRTA